MFLLESATRGDWFAQDFVTNLRCMSGSFQLGLAMPRPHSGEGDSSGLCWGLASLEMQPTWGGSPRDLARPRSGLHRGAGAADCPGLARVFFCLGKGREMGGDHFQHGGCSTQKPEDGSPFLPRLPSLSALWFQDGPSQEVQETQSPKVGGSRERRAPPHGCHMGAALGPTPLLTRSPHATWASSFPAWDRVVF